MGSDRKSSRTLGQQWNYRSRFQMLPEMKDHEYNYIQSSREGVLILRGGLKESEAIAHPLYVLVESSSTLCLWSCHKQGNL